MSAVTLPSSLQAQDASPAPPPAPLARARGLLELRFARRGPASHLAWRDQREPLRVLTPTDRDLGCAGATVVNMAGGLAAGDRLIQRIAVDAGAAAAMSSQAAEKVYRSTGAVTRVATELAAADGGWLEWLPHETVVFDRASLARRIDVRVEGSGRVLAGELLVLGRTASGERLETARLHESWRVHRDGRLVWADALRLDPPNAAPLTADAGFAGALACATLIYAGPDAAERLPCARDLLEDAPARAGATLVSGILVVRMLAADGAALRQAVTNFWRSFRARAGNLPAVLPRAWSL